MQARNKASDMYGRKNTLYRKSTTPRKINYMIQS